MRLAPGQKGLEYVAQVVECLPTRYEDLNSMASIIPSKKAILDLP
jgi:hypothetical protein